MSWVLVVYLLASLDGGFVGYRDAAGRDLRIDKGDHYRRGVLRGLLHGQGLCALVAAAAAAVLALSDAPVALWGSLQAAAAAMLWVYGPYAAVVLGAFAIYAWPSTELRSFMTVTIFGPFTLLRPLVVLIGGLAAILTRPRWEVALLATLAVVLQVFMEPTLGRRWNKPARSG